jgi:hypothetical protein
MCCPLCLDIAQPNSQMPIAHVCSGVSIKNCLPFDRDHGKRSFQKPKGRYALTQQQRSKEF